MESSGKSIFDGLNPAQKEAVENIEGPALIIAGAGSGKTRVLTCRVANILDKGHQPDSVLALTFTNKASREMKERIAAVVGKEKARRLWMGTFHSIFIRFLREEAELLGFPKNFTIYDTTDSRNLIKSIVKELQLDEKLYKPSEVHSRISMAKNNLVTAEAYERNSVAIQNDRAARKPMIFEIYKKYAAKSKANGSMDFDDILLYTNILFRDFPEALERIRDRFRYILVDEYQDTNFAQYLIVKKLAQLHCNIAVVGDDAQSIYSFRGARIENILNFRKDYPQAKEYRLEQNYRSTQTIVNAANSVIAKNKMQLQKKCFSAAEVGEGIELINAYTEQEEGLMVASSILTTIYREKSPYSSFAILYRTNAQSRVIEEALRKKNIPYRIFAGHSFYERAEVKDFLAYLKFILNPQDDQSLLRIINFPARGIGETTLAKLRQIALEKNLVLSEAITSCDLVAAGIKPATATKLKLFIEAISSLRNKVPYTDVYDLAMETNSKFKILDSFREDNSLESQGRAENIEELFNSIKEFVDDMETDFQEARAEGYETPVITLDLYLENVSLISDLDGKADEDDLNKVSLMTVHSSKGLEFEHVYILGMEENLFPSGGQNASETDIEEERRLFYVAVTRAEKSVKLSFAKTRMKWGEHVNNRPSRFLKEIDREYIINPLTDFEEELHTKFDDDSFEQELSGSFGSRRGVYGGGGRAGGGYGSSGVSGGRYGNAGGVSQGHSRFGGAGKSSISRSGEATAVRSAAGLTRRPDSNFKADDPSRIAVNQMIEHDRFGIGKVITIEGEAANRKAIVDFKEGGRKILLLKFAKLRIISE